MKTTHLLLSAIMIIALGWLADGYLINADREKITDQVYQDRDKIQENSPSASGYAEWMKKIRNNPETGSISEKDLNLAKRSYQKNLKKSYSESSLDFEFMGPDNIGGRTRTLLVDNRDNHTLWAAGVAGGLWKSTTNGRAWIPVARNQFENLSISTMCQDEEGNIYVGTGESFSRDPNYIANTGTVGFEGNGILKTTDGINFSPLDATYNNSKFRYINELVSKNGKLYAATNNCLFVSEDKGTTWNKPYSYISYTSDVKVTSSGKIIFVRGTSVCVSSENGTSFVDKSSQFDENFNRVELAIAPSDENIMYALCSYSKYNPANENKYFNLYRSENGGEDWVSVLEQHTPQVDLFRARSQGDYDNVLAVYPDNPNKVILGGIDLWIWKKGSAFEQISLWNAKGGPLFVHADQHDIVFHPNYAENQTIYFTNDGGIFKSDNGGVTFKVLNKNYGVTQYYAIDCGPKGEVLGGTQDNGTPYIDLLQPSDPLTALKFTGGDGGYTAVSELYPGAIFSTIYYSQLFRSNENGQSETTRQTNPFDKAGTINTYDFIKPGIENSGNPFVTPIDLWESFNYADNKIYIPFVIDTVIRFNETGLPDTISTFKEGFVFEVPSTVVNNKFFEYKLTSQDLALMGKDSLVIGDTLPIREKFSSLMAIGAFGQIFFTREILDFKNENPNWDAVVGRLKFPEPPAVAINNEDLDLGEVNHLKWSADGDALYAISGKKVFRFTGFNNAYNYQGMTYSNRVISSENDTTYQMGVIGDDMVWVKQHVFTIDTIKGKEIFDFSGYNKQGTSISIDPNDVNRLIITCGGYGVHNRIYYSENILDETPNFEAIDGNLPEAPVYASLISDTAAANEDLILMGTEYGVYSATNITGNSTNWIKETSIPNVPVFHFDQQTQPNGYLKGVCVTGVENSGVIYAATHGLGVWKMTKYARPFTGFEPPKNQSVNSISIQVYPNPARDYINLTFNTNKPENIKVNLYTLTGKVVYTETINTAIGESKNRINLSSLKKGVYIISATNGLVQKTQKLIIE